jgi:hypothetical protein
MDADTHQNQEICHGTSCDDGVPVITPEQSRLRELDRLARIAALGGGEVPETIDRQPIPQKEQNMPQVNPVQCVETGEIFPSIKAAEIKMNVSGITHVLNGKQRTCGGLTWIRATPGTSGPITPAATPTATAADLVKQRIRRAVKRRSNHEPVEPDSNEQAPAAPIVAATPDTPVSVPPGRSTSRVRFVFVEYEGNDIAAQLGSLVSKLMEPRA